jgi:Uncharacterised nucleotidyltransferase
MVDAVAAVWVMIDRLIDEGRTDTWLGDQRLLPLAAERRYHRDMAVSPAQRRAARGVAADQAVAEHLLSEVRAAVRGAVLVLKGPELAACYPRPGLRPFADVDVLVPDVDAAAVELQHAGFDWRTELGSHAGHHHLAPFRWGPLPMPLEVHLRPAWVPWCPSPPWSELAASSEESRTGVGGLQRPDDAHHAVLVAVHAWRSRPYGRLLDLADVWLLAHQAGPERAADVAQRWGVARLWGATWAAAEALVAGTRRRSKAVRVLGRHLSGRRAAPPPSRVRYAGGLLVTAPGRAVPGLARRAPRAAAGRSPAARDRR